MHVSKCSVVLKLQKCDCLSPILTISGQKCDEWRGVGRNGDGMNMWLVQKLCTTGLHPPGTKDFGMKEIKMTVLFWNGNAYNTAVCYLIIEDKMLPMATGYRISVQGFVRCKDNRSFRSKQEINLSEGGKICKIISLAPLAVFKQTSHNWSEIGGKNQEN